MVVSVKSNLAVPQTVKDGVTTGPAIPLLYIYPREMKSYVHTKTCARMFLSSVICNRGEVETNQTVQLIDE